MSTSNELSPQTFARLQSHAVPLIDTIETVINRLVDFYEARSGAPLANSGDGDAPSVRQFSASNPPDLTNTKVLAVELANRALEPDQAKWNRLLVAAIREARGRVKTFSDLKRHVPVNIVDGQKTDQGYRFYSDIGISIQGQDANASWRAACHTAQQLGFQLRVTFLWLDKAGAAFPGMTGQLSVGDR